MEITKWRDHNAGVIKDSNFTLESCMVRIRQFVHVTKRVTDGHRDMISQSTFSYIKIV
jgi:hypothetical protein